MDTFRPILSRLVAPYVAGLIVWLAARGFGLPTGTDSKITELVVILLLATMQALYGLLHKVIDKHVNPADAASSSIATESHLLEKKSLSKDDYDKVRAIQARREL